MKAHEFLSAVPVEFLDGWLARWDEEAREIQTTIEVFEAAVLRDMDRARRSVAVDEDVFDGDPDAMLESYLELSAQRARHDALSELIAAAQVLSQSRA